MSHGRPATCRTYGSPLAHGRVNCADLLCRPVLTTSVFDHLYLDDVSVSGWRRILLIVDGYSASSRRQAKQYTKLFSVRPSLVTDGVGTSLFRPSNLDRLREVDRPLVVGWAGNSEWGGGRLGEDPKRFRTVLMPALEIARSFGVELVGHFAERNVRQRSRAEMVDYYSEIDVLVIVSSHEGTPNPLLEAMACGVPVVATNVGVVPDVLGPMQQEFILPYREPQALAHVLKGLASSPQLRLELSAENLESAKGLDWMLRVPSWLQLWRDAEARHRDSEPLKRHFFFNVIDAHRASVKSARKLRSLQKSGRRQRTCPASAPLGQIGRIEQERVSGSS